MENLEKIIKFKIDDHEVEAAEGSNILEIARREGIEIPALCYHPDLCVKANCRMCMVEINGKMISPACATKAVEGMSVVTKSDKINAVRRTNLELLLAQHREECDDCVWMANCQLLKLAKEYGADIRKFKDRKSEFPIRKFGPIEFDQTKCIDCRNCVEMCNRQSGGFLQQVDRGYNIHIEPSTDKKKDCIYCGQCIVHCPVGAIEAEGEFEEIENPLQEKGKTVVVQFAPSIRASIGEMFGMPHGTVAEGQLVSGLRKLGFAKVFDVATTADFTTIEEADELIERITDKKPMPMFTSCCPAWVRYVEFFRPDLIPNLTSARSPQSMLGGLIKTYWAQKENIDPKNIVVVSIMPCTAKKYEITKEENLINGVRRIDYVLTTRELGRLLAKHNIDLKNLAPEAADSPLAEYTGAAVIYGATGGVMESAIRTAYWRLTGTNLPSIECHPVRGIVGLKTAEIMISGLKLKVAVANGMDSARRVLDDLAKDPHAYDYIEIMACPGGCIGGGGQPLPVSDEIRQKRAQALYSIDCAKSVRFAHENQSVQNIYKEYFAGDKEKIHSLFHTHYSPKQKTEIKNIKLDNN